ncbi:MAG: phosphate signaling complex protein PhoU [Pseudomonadota bacterium]
MASVRPVPKPLDFNRIEIELAQMAALVETNLADVIMAFERCAVTSAEEIIDADKRVDQFHHTIETGVYGLLEAHALPANLIREAMTIVKIAADLERVGDLTRNVARRTVIISRNGPGVPHTGVTRMGRICLQQLSDVLNAYTSRDLIAARAVWVGDNEVDELYHSVFRQIMGAMSEDTNRVKSSTHLMFIAKNFERVADHATNIAEALHFLVTGEAMSATPAKPWPKTSEVPVSRTLR